MEEGLRQRAVGSFPLPLLHYPRSSGALGGPPRFLSLRSFPRRTAFGRLRRVCDGGRMTTEHGELRKEGPYRCNLPARATRLPFPFPSLRLRLRSDRDETRK